eukprot:7380671-Prymnesium_polylepis.1
MRDHRRGTAHHPAERSPPAARSGTPLSPRRHHPNSPSALRAPSPRPRCLVRSHERPPPERIVRCPASTHTARQA